MKMSLKKRLEKSCQKAALLFFLILMGAWILSVPAFGATSSAPATVRIPVSVVADGEVPVQPENYTIRLTATDSAPLPELAGNYVDLVLTGPGTAEFPPLLFQTVGIYRYSIFQIKGDYPDAYYDPGVYTVTVTVTNAEGENSRIATVALKKDGMKWEDAEFINNYSKTPVFGGDDPPDSDTPIDPPPDDRPEEGPVDEPPTEPKEPIILGRDDPQTETLIQTGQLNGPVWLFGGMGTALIALGVLLMKKDGKKRKSEEIS